MKLYETPLTDDVFERLIAFSVAWEQENSCWGYRRNERSDIEDNRIFLAETDGEIVGYLFGHATAAERDYAMMPKQSSLFELEELYVVPSMRSQGIGASLFRFVQDQLRQEELQYILLSTATKNVRVKKL